MTKFIDNRAEQNVAGLWRWALLFFAMLSMSVHVVGCHSPPASYVSPVDDSLIGKSEAMAVAELGKPWREFPGHFGLPHLDWTKKFTGEIKTAVFKKPGGDVYVSFENRNSIWYVISYSWLPEGAAF